MVSFISFSLAGDYMVAGVYGLFVVLVLFWQARWQQYPFGIMKGYGLIGIVGMLADLLRSELGKRTDVFFSYAPAVVYIPACLIWLGTFIKTEPLRRSVRASFVDMDEILDLLGRLKQAIR